MLCDSVSLVPRVDLRHVPAAAEQCLRTNTCHALMHALLACVLHPTLFMH